MNKSFVIASVLMAAALTGILSTSSIAFAQDESETNTEQEIKQKNFGSGESVNENTAQDVDTVLGLVCP